MSQQVKLKSELKTRTGVLRTVFQWVCVLSLTLLFMLSAQACLDESQMCGDEMVVLDDGFCGPKQQVETTDTATHDTATSDTGTDTETSTEGDGLPEGMDAACSETMPCTGEADFCNQVPGSPEGVCTIQGCTIEPDDCPPGYVCFDLSVIVPTLPTICQQDEL